MKGPASGNSSFFYLDPAYFSDNNLKKRILKLKKENERRSKLLSLLASGKPKVTKIKRNSSVGLLTNKYLAGKEFSPKTVKNRTAISLKKDSKIKNVVAAYELNENALRIKLKPPREIERSSPMVKDLKEKIVSFSSVLSVISPSISKEKIKLNKLLSTVKKDQKIKHKDKKQLTNNILAFLNNKPYKNQNLSRSELVKELFNNNK